jgi:hypothetical protein
MWGTSSPIDKLTGNLGEVIEAAQIGVLRSDRLTAGKSSPGNFRLLQHNPLRKRTCVNDLAMFEKLPTAVVRVATDMFRSSVYISFPNRMDSDRCAQHQRREPERLTSRYRDRLW